MPFEIEIGNQKSEAGYSNLEDGHWKVEIGMENRSRRLFLHSGKGIITN